MSRNDDEAQNYVNVLAAQTQIIFTLSAILESIKKV